MIVDSNSHGGGAGPAFNRMVRCPACGDAAPPDFEIRGGEDRWTLTAACPGCRTPRTFSFRTIGHPLDVTPEHRHLGGLAPSPVVSPAQFLAELDRLLPELEALEVERLDPATWRARTEAKNRASTCVIELSKLTSPPRADLRAIRDRLLDLDARFAADAPRIWALEEAST